MAGVIEVGRQPVAPSGALRRHHWVDQVERHAHERPSAVALRCAGRSVRWAELAERTRRIAGWLRAAGVGPGDRVALVLTNGPEFIELLVAASRLGAISVPVNFRLTAPEIGYILADADAAVVVSDSVTVDAVAQASTHDAAHHLFVGAEEGRDATTGTTPYAVAVTSELPDEASWPDVPEHQPALIMYTSGTTGRPKGAVLTYLNLMAQCVTLIAAWSMKSDGEVNLVASPLFHIGALGSVAPSLLLGARVVIAPTAGFDADATLDLLVDEEVTSVFLVPAQWQLICEALERRPRPLPRLRVAGWGAAPADAGLLRRIATVLPGVDIVALFGQTEMSPVTCVLDGKDAIRKVETVGRPAPQVSIRVVDDEMNDVAPGEVGEIVYRGPGTMSHYWNAPEATAEAFAGGWFHSGDMVSVDDEGFVRVRDRKKDMLITGGENVYCVEVEHILADHPDVADIAVIGREDAKWGQTPVAVIVPRDPSAGVDVKALRDWATSSLARYKLPTAVEIVDALPRNATGKVDKQTLRELYGRSSTTA